jgi:DNA polymerase III subunit gamma/tau
MSDPSTSAAGYRVLARKYRPKTFADLIGQEALVRTLTNAFATGRIAQAYMLTGVRGVGKTTTARLIARALNYPAGPAIDMAEITPQCEAILESRHMDVIEMDAASNTGVDNMREIIDSVRYAPVQARTKVYIIDEVHMLSKSAFNALLKTLEEPPPHVKFIFATTEIRKVPVTILSRCQRFDLRRLDAELLTLHYGNIAKLERVEAEEDALRMIARAAEGSVRDGLSLLDQAIAYGDGHVKTADVTSMLGLADRGQVIDLFGHVMSGDVAAALSQIKMQYDAGADPETILTDLTDFVHWVTRLKVARESALMDGLRSGEEKSRGLEFADTITVSNLTRVWQLLLKGISETAIASQPLAAAEMVVIRIAHAAQLPSGEDLVKLVQKVAPVSASPSPVVITKDFRKAPVEAPVVGNLAVTPVPERATDQNVSPPTALAKFSDIIALARERRDIKLTGELEQHVRPVRVADGHIELVLENGAPAGLPGELSRKLEAWTGRRWIVSVVKSGGSDTFAKTRQAAKDLGMKDALEHPDVLAILKRFPGSTIVDVRQPETLEKAESSDEEPV